MLDSHGYNTLKTILSIAERIEEDPTNDWTKIRAAEIASWVTVLIEREDRGREIIAAALERIQDA